MGATNPLRPVYRDLDWGELPPAEYSITHRKHNGRWVSVWVSVHGNASRVAVMARSGVHVATFRCKGSGFLGILIGEHMAGTPEAKASDDHKRIRIFDCFLPGMHKTYADRIEIYESALMDMGPRFMAVHQAFGNLAENMKQAQDEDWEGLIFRNPDAPYFAPIYRMVRRDA